MYIKYKGYLIERSLYGIKYYTRTDKGDLLRADTLIGIKKLINNYK